MLALPHLMLLLDLDAGPMGHAQTGRTTRTGNEQQADGRRLHVLPANTRKDSQSREEKGVLKRVDNEQSGLLAACRQHGRKGG